MAPDRRGLDDAGCWLALNDAGVAHNVGVSLPSIRTLIAPQGTCTSVQQGSHAPVPYDKPRRVAAVAASPNSTSDRIIEVSLKLFNEFGFQNVPLLRIATRLGMSSGNLSYHFKTKADIVLAVFPLLEKALRDTKQREGPFLPSNAALHQIQVFHTLWRYRFFFNALTKLLSEDIELRRRFMSLQETVITAMQELFDELIQQKYMFPVKHPNSTGLLAKSCYLVWLSWLRFEQIEHPGREIVRSAAIYDAVMLNWSIVQPYFPEDFSQQMMGELRDAISIYEADKTKPVKGRGRTLAPRKQRKTGAARA